MSLDDPARQRRVLLQEDAERLRAVATGAR